MAICFTKYLLSEKHQLSKIWLAAHWEKRIKRTQIFEVDIEKSVQDMVEAEIILDLRISGHLLVGIVKIHAKKSKYLLTECSSIFYQIKVFRIGTIDLPQNKQTAAVNDITLKEFFDNFDDVHNDVLDAILSSNQSRIEDITLKETNERLTLYDENDMQDCVFNEDNIFENFEENLMSLHESLGIPDELTALLKKKETVSISSQSKNRRHFSITNQESIISLNVYNDKDMFDLNNSNYEPFNTNSNTSAERVSSLCIQNSKTDQRQSLSDFGSLSAFSNSENTAVLNLEPLKISKKKLLTSKVSRKRKLCVDNIKSLSYDVMKKHVQDTSSITTMLILAPASKRLMVLKEIGCAEMLLQLPVMKLQNPKLLKVYNQNLRTQESDDFELPCEKESLECVDRPRKKSRTNFLIEVGNSSENFDAAPSSKKKSCINFDNQTDAPALDGDFMMNTELVNGLSESVFGSENSNHLSPKVTFSNINQADDASNAQSTQLSKTSQERWEYALQDRMVQMIKYLKPLFQQKSVLCLSSLVDNNRRILVAQKIFCLLMLKKFEVICLEQSDNFGEVYITQDLNFDTAYIKFCDS